MNKAFLLIGGNTGNREKNLQQARAYIEKDGGILVKASHVYETAAWGKTDQASFLNQALLIDTGLAAQALLETVLRIETQMGRYRAEKYGPRIIDIDILLYNNDIIDTADLQVPHPALHLRRFALEPLNEIAPELQHPVLHQPISYLLEHCPDLLAVKKLNN